MKPNLTAKKLLAQYPDWLEEAIIQQAAFYLSYADIARKFKRNRNTVCKWMKLPEVMQQVQDKRKELIAQRVAELGKLDDMSIQRVKEAIARGDTRAALTHLAGRGIYTNKQEVSGDLKVEIVQALVDHPKE